MTTEQPRLPAQKIIDVSTENNYPAQQHYMVMSTTGGPLEPIFEHLAAHLRYHERLEREGTEFAAGPIWTADGKGWEGTGLMVFKAGSLAEADALAAADPMHTSGARTYTITPWMINHGVLSHGIAPAAAQSTEQSTDQNSDHNEVKA